MTQLGHVKDLATAFVKILGNPKAARQVYNVAGERYVTFDGLAKACAAAMGAPEPELVHFNPKDFDFGGWWTRLTARAAGACWSAAWARPAPFFA